MIDTLAAHIVRGAVHHAITKRDEVVVVPDHGQFTITPGGGFALFVVGLAFVITLTAFRYTCWGVVAALAFVEKDGVGSSIDIDDPPAYEYSERQTRDAEGQTIMHSVVTSGLRRTLQHLRAIGGWRSWFRGLACFACYHMAFFFLAGIVANVLNMFTFGYVWMLSEFVGGLVASIVLIQVRTAWTHIVISEPSPKRWTRRLPPFRRTLDNVWLVTLINELCVRATILIPAGVAVLMGLNFWSMNQQSLAGSPGAILGKAIALLILSFALFVALVIPSSIALSRVQASMLPEEDETIVPFDRSFGGKVEPAIVGGSGALKLVDAFKTIDDAARQRVLKLFVKFVIVEVVLHVVFVGAMATIFLTTVSAVKSSDGA